VTGTIYDITIDNTTSGTIDHQWDGYGNTDADWTDQIGSNDGTVNGSPARYNLDTGDISNDAVQTTTANQPLVVENGALVTDGGKPAIKYDGVSDQMDINGLALLSLTYGAFFVGSITDNTTSSLKTIFDSSDSTRGGFSLSYGNTTNKLTPFWFDGDDNSVNVFSGGSNLTSNQALYSVIIKTGASATYIDGSENDTRANTWVLAGTNTFTKSTLGYDQDNLSRLFTGKMQELILFETDESTNREAIETNINNHYNIY